MLLAFAGASVYFVQVPDHPPGFSIDESSICYNASTISTTGRDEYSQPWPLFFRAFGEYKNPTVIYLLAGIFRVVGPSIAAARFLSAAMGLAACLLLGGLAWQMTRRWTATVTVAVSAMLTPWLFESSRLVFEVAIYPAILVLFLLVVWRCSRKAKWSWPDVLALAGTLALLTYSYSIGRLLGPLFAVGLVFFINQQRASGLARTWVAFAILLLPLIAFHLSHPDALTGRFKALTYLGNELTAAGAAKQFVLHYAANLNPWRWLITGEDNVRDHLRGTGALLVATVGLGLFGGSLIVRKHRRDPWWRFVIWSLAVSVVPASLTGNPFPQLRLIAFPVLFLVLAIPAVSWFTEPNHSIRRWFLGAVVTLTVAQGAYFQWLYHKKAPSLWYVFDARFPTKVLTPGLASGIRPIHLLDDTGKAGYIHALWYGAVARLQPGVFVRAPSSDSLPPGSVVISTEEDCRDCKVIARALNYIVYLTPPYPDLPLPLKGPLKEFRAELVADRAPQVLRVGETAAFNFRVKNVSAEEWATLGDSEGDYAVKLAGRWLGFGHNTEKRLPFDVEPGDTVGLTLQVTAPDAPGEYLLEVDLYQEKAGWFGDRGSRSWKSKVQVVPEK